MGAHGSESKASTGMMAEALACHDAPDPQGSVGEAGYTNRKSPGSSGAWHAGMSRPEGVRQSWAGPSHSL